MNKYMIASIVMFGVALMLLIATTGTAAQTALSRFEGSVEKGVYEVDYARIAYTTTAARAPEILRVEGALVSRVYVKPKDKTNLEVFRSYQRELAVAGFMIHLAAESGSATELTARALYAEPHTARSALDRIGPQKIVLRAVILHDWVRRPITT